MMIMRIIIPINFNLIYCRLHVSKKTHKLMFLGDWFHFLCCDFFLWANVSFMIATICVWRGPTFRASHTSVFEFKKPCLHSKNVKKGVNYVEEKLSLGIFVAVNFARSSFWVFFVISDPQWKWHSGIDVKYLKTPLNTKHRSTSPHAVINVPESLELWTGKH